jgi:hypothetical protein
MKHKEAQFISVDVIIATLIFLAAVALFLVFLNSGSDKDKAESVKADAELLPSQLISNNQSETAIVVRNKVDLSRLSSIKSQDVTDYNQLKSKLGIKNDFCIYFVDKNGKVVPLEDFVGLPDVYGIGSDRANVSGFSCKQ